MSETYTKHLFYQIELTSRYFKFLANQLFKKLEIKASPIDVATLDILMETPNLCQRDLAKILLKDRANTGKIINNLEELGFVVRYIDTKGKRLVKKVKISEKGINFLKEVNKKTKHIRDLLEKQVLLKEQKQAIKSLKNIREFIKENIETNI